jgi:hypothetical protein
MNSNACRGFNPVIDVVNTGAKDREDCDKVACCSVIDGSDLVKLVCKESHDGAARDWMVE